MSNRDADPEKVLLERDGGVLWVRFNRPEKRNALTGPMYRQIRSALLQAAGDDNVRVLAFAGEGDAFTAGNDLEDFATWGDYLAEGRQPPVLDLMDTVLAFEKPMMAAVRGPAVGIGTTLLPHCDLVLASETARFALPFTRLGLVPEFGSSMLLPCLAGAVRASHALLLGEPFDRDRAVELGLVSECCEDGQLDMLARERGRSLAALPPAAVRATRKLLRPDHERDRLRQAMEAEKQAFIAGLGSAEHREAVAAFFEKRPPRFGN